MRLKENILSVCLLSSVLLLLYISSSPCIWYRSVHISFTLITISPTHIHIEHLDRDSLCQLVLCVLGQFSLCSINQQQEIAEWLMLCIDLFKPKTHFVSVANESASMFVFLQCCLVFTFYHDPDWFKWIEICPSPTKQSITAHWCEIVMMLMSALVLWNRLYRCICGGHGDESCSYRAIAWIQWSFIQIYSFYFRPNSSDFLFDFIWLCFIMVFKSICWTQFRLINFRNEMMFFKRFEILKK